MSLQDIHDIYAVNHIKSVVINVSDGSIINNSNIVSEKFELTDSLCSYNELVFGSCESACLKLQVATEDKEFKDLWLDVRAIIQDDNGDIMLDDGVHYLITDTGEKIRMSPYLNSKMIGRFKVVIDEPVADRSWRNLTCYDKMYDIVRADIASWYSGLTFPMTLKTFRDSLFNYLGVEQETVTLINDNLVLQGGFKANGVLYGRTIVMAICELNGVFGHMSMNGKMDYVSIPNGESIEYPYYVDGTGSYERDTVDPITGVIAREDEYDVGTTVGTTTNPIYITGNPLIYGLEGTQDLTDALTALLDKIDDITYRPFGVQSFGDPVIPLGTAVEIETRDITINSYIISKRLTGVQALRDYIAAMGEKERLNDDPDLSSYIVRTKGKVHDLQVDVDTLNSTIYDEDTGVVSEISQMSNEIVLKVDSNGKVVNVALTAEATGTAFKVLADNIDFISNGKIQLTSKNLEINSTNFQVDSTGALTCTRATISGTTVQTNYTFNYTINPESWLVVKTSTDGNVVLRTIMTPGNYHAYYSNTGNSYSMNMSSSRIEFKRNDTTYNVITTTSSDRVYIGEDTGSAGTTPIKKIWCYDFVAYATKSRAVETEDYGTKLLYCYETPTPMFGDVGEGKIAEDGKCYVRTDSTFNQTIADGSYQVFLQKYGQGECYVTERKADYFVVEGTAGMKFGFEIKAKQAGYENLRLETERNTPQINEYYFGTYELNQDDYGQMAIEHIEEIADEREVA